jgi:putative transposase
MLRQKKYPAIRKKLWGEALWSPSYFAASCGGAPISVIRQYIEQQRIKHLWFSFHIPTGGMV